PKADLILANGKIYTVNIEQPWVSHIAIHDGKIVATGDASILAEWAGEETEVQDLEEAFVMPGFIEGHGHFSGLGMSLLNLNFLQSKSWDEIVAKVAEAAAELEPGVWIEGRGWHQEKWDERPGQNVNGYPLHYDLSAAAPDNPVILFHASGHSLFANDAAMELAAVTAESVSPEGGEVVKDAQGQPIGVFEERAMKLITNSYQEYLDGLPPEALNAKWYRAIELAQEECLAKGITSFQDAGSKYYEIERYTGLAENDSLDLRLWVMLRHSHEEMKDRMEGFPIIDAGAGYFSCRAIKTEVDGALGAFGAWLLAPYHDKPDFLGQNTTSVQEVKNIATLAREHKMQLCVHAIGDRANRVVLNIMEEEKPKFGQEDWRWRIEHAQHLDTTDIPRFRTLGIIASMQGIHCTSDAPFVVSRLGEDRARLGAYPWRSLLDAGVVIANGTDAPVEDVDPLISYYASVTRKRADNGFEFFPEQRMTREEAVYSYTLGNAFAAFEDNWKGSIEPGKVADLVVLSKNLIDCTDEEILEAEVMQTMVGGETKYRKE
ncbi:MAG: amidohydrolase, partial [Bacteroidota bacterium]